MKTTRYLVIFHIIFWFYFILTYQTCRANEPSTKSSPSIHLPYKRVASTANRVEVSQENTATGIVIEEHYQQILERTNQQLSAVSGNYQTLFTILGVIVGIVTFLLGIGGIAVTVLIFRQSGEYKRAAEDMKRGILKNTNDFLEGQKKLASEFVNQQKQFLEERAKENKDLSEKLESELKGNIAQLKQDLETSKTDDERKTLRIQIQKLQSDVIMVQAQLASSGAIPIYSGVGIPFQSASGTAGPLLHVSSVSCLNPLESIFSVDSANKALHTCSKCGQLYVLPKSIVFMPTLTSCPYCGTPAE